MRVACATVFAVLTSAGCATTVYGFRPGDERVTVAVQRPFHDLGMLQEVPPEVLTRAAEDPYALPAGFDCETNLSEIAVLDQVLGPDLRLPGEAGENDQLDAPGLAADVIGGVISLPYSNILRELTGTAQRDRILRGAIFAGMVRRSFLRGVVLANDCLLEIEPEIQAAQPTEADVATSKSSVDEKTAVAAKAPLSIAPPD